MTDTWNRLRKKVIGGTVFWFLDGFAIIDFDGENTHAGPKFEAWLEKVKEELRDARAQSRVHRQHRMLYQSQRDELGETLELIDTMLQRSVDYWRRSDEDHAEYCVDAYRCVQENIKSIKAKIQSSTPKVNKDE